MTRGRPLRGPELGHGEDGLKIAAAITAIG